MKTRLLRRKVLIREYDYEKVREQAIPVLYDRTEFTPLNKDSLEKLKLVDLLKGRHTPITEVSLNLKHPALTLYELKDYLYNEKYYNWNVTLDEEGYICVQARKNTPISRIGMGIFEKDIKCRI